MVFSLVGEMLAKYQVVGFQDFYLLKSRYEYMFVLKSCRVVTKDLS